MTSVSCLALILYMEASTQSLHTQTLVADVVIARAEKEKLSICSSMKKPKSYSWMWDRKRTKVQKEKLESLKKIASQEIRRNKSRARLYFNECSLGKRFKTPNRMIRSEKLCFY